MSKTKTEVVIGNAVPKVEVSFKVTQNDVIEAMVDEQREVFETAVDLLSKQCRDLQTECQGVMEIFGKEHGAKARKHFQRLISYFGRQFDGEATTSFSDLRYDGYHRHVGSCITIHVKIENTYNEMNLVYDIPETERIAVEKEMFELNEQLIQLHKQTEKAEYDLKVFNKSKGKFKREVIKRLLKESKEGQKFMKDFKQIGNTIGSEIQKQIGN